jgi:YD repeat-containing protein
VPNDSSPDTGIADYWYDPRGLLTKMVDARAVETDFTYDNAGRRLTKTFPAAAGENVAYSYDGGSRGVGRLTGLTEVAGGPGTKWGGFNWGGAPWTAGYFATFKYDARGNLIQEQRSIGGVNYTTTYTYDLADRLSSLTYPSGRIVTYARDGFGRISGVTTKVNGAGPTVTVAAGLTWLPMGSGSGVPSPESDAFALPSPDETAGGAVGGSGTPPGVSAMASGALPGDAFLLGSLTYGNGLVLQRTFTSDGDLDWLSVSDPAVTPGVFLLSRQHVRGNQLDLTGIWDQTANTNSQTFGCTDADRLQSGVGPWGTLNYGYDASGNRTAESLVSGGTTQNDAYSYVAGSNRLDHIDRNGTLFRSFTSDAAGNIVAETRSSTAYAYLHNQNGRLSEIDVNGTPTATYLYDALERLTVRVTMNMTPAGTTHFISDPAGHILAEARRWTASRTSSCSQRPAARPRHEFAAWCAEYCARLTWNGCAEFGEIVFGFGDALGQRSLQPEPPPCWAKLPGQAAGEIAAEHQLALPVPALGGGGEPFLRRLMIERQALARGVHGPEREHRTGVTVSGTPLEQLQRLLGSARTAAPVEQHLGESDLRVQNAAVGGPGEPDARLFRVGGDATTILEEAAVHVLGFGDALGRFSQPSRRLLLVLPNADALGETKPQIKGRDQVAGRGRRLEPSGDARRI